MRITSTKFVFAQGQRRGTGGKRTNTHEAGPRRSAAIQPCPATASGWMAGFPSLCSAAIQHVHVPRDSKSPAEKRPALQKDNDVCFNSYGPKIEVPTRCRITWPQSVKWTKQRSGRLLAAIALADGQEPCGGPDSLERRRKGGFWSLWKGRWSRRMVVGQS